jgi:hypothetical protein
MPFDFSDDEADVTVVPARRPCLMGSPAASLASSSSLSPARDKRPRMHPLPAKSAEELTVEATVDMDVRDRGESQAKVSRTPPYTLLRDPQTLGFSAAATRPTLAI